jgi:hypothetical protein
MAFWKQHLALYERSDTVREVDANEIDFDNVDFEKQARLFCTYVIERLPEGTVQEFAEMTGMDPEKLLSAGIDIYHNREKENDNYKLEKKPIKRGRPSKEKT